MNERIKQLAEQARNYALDQKRHYESVHNTEQCLEEYREVYNIKFAELIVKDCMVISKTWEDQLEKAKQLSESNAVGIVTYRISRQFGVEE